MRRLAGLLVLLASAAGLSACSDDASRLTVYSGRSEELIGPLLTRFSEETGVAVDYRPGESADLALLVDQEGDRTPADVFISQSPGALGFLAGDGRLARLPGDILSQVGAEYRSEAGQWVGLSGRVRSLVYNTEEISEDDLPASVFELTDERYQGQVGVAPSNGSFQDFVTAMREIEGEAAAEGWLDGMAANDSPTFANNGAIVQAVASGEVPMGLVNHYYNEQQLSEDPSSPTANWFFSDGDIGRLLLVSGAAVVEGTDLAGDAERLVSFLLSEDSQRFFSQETIEYPLVAGVDPEEGLPPLEDIATAGFGFDQLGGGLERTTELIDASGLESS